MNPIHTCGRTLTPAGGSFWGAGPPHPDHLPEIASYITLPLHGIHPSATGVFVPRSPRSQPVYPLAVPTVDRPRLQREAERTALNLMGRTNGRESLKERLAAAEAWAAAHAGQLALTYGGALGAGCLQLIRAAAHNSAWAEEFLSQAARIDLETDERGSNRVTRLVEVAARLNAEVRYQLAAALALAEQQAKHAASLIRSADDILAEYMVDDPPKS